MLCVTLVSVPIQTARPIIFQPRKPTSNSSSFPFTFWSCRHQVPISTTALIHWRVTLRNLALAFMSATLPRHCLHSCLSLALNISFAWLCLCLLYDSTLSVSHNTIFELVLFGPIFLLLNNSQLLFFFFLSWPVSIH